jgi:hypothetical protein
MKAERPNKQEDVEDVIVEVLEHQRTMTTAEVTAAVKTRLRLVPADLERAAKRENESKIDQIIANALQAERRLCRDRLIERVGLGIFRITASGLSYLADHRAEVEAASKLLDNMFPDGI